MSTHTLKLLSEAYRNIAQAPTQTYVKGGILDLLEGMIQEEIDKIKHPTKATNLSDEIPF